MNRINNNKKHPGICSKCEVYSEVLWKGKCPSCFRKDFRWSPEVKEKIRKANTGKDNSSRGKAISKSLQQKPLTEKEWELLRKFHVEHPWISNMEIFVKRSEIEKVYGERLKKAKLEEIWEKIIKPSQDKNRKSLPLKIQMWSDETIKNFLSDIDRVEYFSGTAQSFFAAKYNVKSVNAFVHYVEVFSGKKLFGFPSTSKPRSKQTWIEKWCRECLLEFKVMFRAERYVNNCKWRVDFLVGKNLVIEMSGTYTHGDARVYEEEDLNDFQKANKKRDKEKISWLKNNGYEVLEIWEKDLEEHPRKCKKQLKEFVGDYIDGAENDLFRDIV